MDYRRDDRYPDDHHPGPDPQSHLSRRGFLLGAAAAGGAALAGGLVLGRSLNPPSSQTSRASTGPAAPGRGPLVLITLYGGNDGLNTVVPYLDGAYHAARPTLGYSPSQVLDLADGLGLNPQLKGLQSLWKAKQLAIVRGVGYPGPNLSHFASMDIWQTANPVDGSGPGWLGRWLDATGDDPMRAISIGATLPPLLRGEKQSATAVTAAQITLPGSEAFQSAFAALQAPGSDRPGLAGMVASAGTDLLQVRTQLSHLAPPVTPAAAPAPGAAPAATGARTRSAKGTDLAGQMDIVAALINAGAPTRLYQVSLTSFDTHADEKANHERLLGELDGAVSRFLDTVAASPAGRQAVVMTYSEFGRRPAENASGGTDHGAAAPLFVAGHGVKGGQFYGDEPSLSSLDANGNLKYSVDFRSVYATVLDRAIGVDPVSILGGRFPTIPFV